MKFDYSNEVIRNVGLKTGGYINLNKKAQFVGDIWTSLFKFVCLNVLEASITGDLSEFHRQK